MTLINKLLCAALLFQSIGFSQAAEHHEGEHEGRHDGEQHAGEGEAIKGPHGGTLLQDGDFAIELTIFETGIAPEMRVYIYQDTKPVKPQGVDLSVTLDRLGGDQDRLAFTAEGDYLVSNQEVTEPHSFDVSVIARFQSKQYDWRFESHEGRSEISERVLRAASVTTEQATPQTLTFTDTLFGVIEAPTDSVFQLSAPYPSLIERLYVKVGDPIKKGQRLATLKNTETLQTYPLTSPADGEVTEVMANIGARVDQAPLVEVTDLSKVWVELSAFPASIEKLAVGQPVSIYDMHKHERAVSSISYIAPQMTGGHIARARAVMDNSGGHWRPGMHIKADVQIEQREVSLAVRDAGLQSFREMPVVFAKYGNYFEVRMLELGDSDGDFTEVLGGLKPGTEYVTGNSFLIKADLLKDGASHDH